MTDDMTTILITALTTLLIAIVAAILGARLQASRERANWLRDKRYEVCTTVLKTIDNRDAHQKIGPFERSDPLPIPADLYAELDVLGMDAVTEAVERCNSALYRLEQDLKPGDDFDVKLYERLQSDFDATRRAYVAEVRRALGVKAV